MVNSRFVGSAFILAAVTCIFAGPIQQLHDETMGLNEGMYASPELAEELARSYAALAWAQRNGNSIDAGIQKRNLDQIGGGTGRLQNPRDDSHAGHLRQPSRLVFERDSDLRRKSGWPNTVNGVEIYEGALKRNMDEIDRTGFDNFVKRNFDEIDRSGWDSFVKRRIANAYFSGRQH